MIGIATLIYIFLQKYIVPFFFVIGIFYFLHGVIRYFFIGRGGDEENSQLGRELFLKAIGWFLVAIIIHLIVWVFGWLTTLNWSMSTNLPAGGVDGGIDRNDAVLQVPDAPRR